MEIIISTLFEIYVGVKFSSEVALFKRFQEYSNFIDSDKYEWGISFDDVANLGKGRLHETINYAKKSLEEQRETKLRGDNKEPLEIVIIFLE